MRVVRAMVVAVVTVLATGLATAGVVAVPQAVPRDLVPPPDGAPVTVPALQQWEAGGTAFELKPGALHVLVDPASADELTADAETFAEDLEALTGQHVVVRQTPPGRGQGPGTIRLTLDPGWTDHGPEANRIAVDGDVTISGPTSDGVFAGTRSVLQLLRQSDRIPGGVATDWPGYAERSFMVDNGRKYFTPAWAERQIRELSYLKYNQFRWHFADNQGFRIESLTHPEIVSPEHWTQEQVRDLVTYAEKYHVDVIPEIDMPGHMQYALRQHPDLQVVDADGNRNANNLDPTNPAARVFVQEILDELIPLFSGTYVHTGGDEYTSSWDDYPVLTAWAQKTYGPEANAHDAVLDFTNFVNDVVRAHGRTMRMWNDGAQGGAVLEASRDIVLEYWSSQHGGVLAQEFLDAGYQLVNANRDVLYQVPGATPVWNNLDPRTITDSWDMSQWHDWIGPNTTGPHHPGILGGQIHVWNDSPGARTEEQIAGLVQMPLRAMIQQLWGSPLPEAGWDALAARAFAVGNEPQWALLDDGGTNVAQGAPVWVSSKERPDCQESALVDGDGRTRWCGSKTAPQSVVIDLGGAVDLGTIVLDWETAFASGYTVEVSDDLATWTTLAEVSGGDGGTDRLAVAGTGRYVRLSMHERGTSYGYSLYEIEVYAASALVPRDFSATVSPAVVLATPGQPGDATLIVSNASADDVTVRWSASPPDGVELAATSGTLRLPAGGSASAALAVTSADARSAVVPITVAGGSTRDPVALASTDLHVSVPYEQLAEAYTNVAVTTDADVNPPTLGVGFDGAGSSYSAEALAAVGVVPGSELSSGGVSVHWPDVAPAVPNNIVANGQSVLIGASGTALGVLAASTYGPVAGDWVVHYDDGTSEVVRLSAPDWSAAPPAGSTVLATMSTRNTPTGPTARRTQLFLLTIPLDPSRTVTALTFPVVSESVVRGDPALHVFDVGIG